MWLHPPRSGGDPSEDRVERAFTDDRPNRLWVADVTQHRTGEGWVYLAAVQDVFSRRIVGWAIADHMRTEPVVDALQRPTGKADALLASGAVSGISCHDD